MHAVRRSSGASASTSAAAKLTIELVGTISIISVKKDQLTVKLSHWAVKKGFAPGIADEK
jgi:hypothetical protein